MLLENYRKETPFAARDNMLDIWKYTTELSFRGFGKKKRRKEKTPKNFDQWSDESKAKWFVQAENKLAWQEQWDVMFINNETRVVDSLCRQIVYLIDRANALNPQYLSECDEQRKMQDEAIGYCNNLMRELNHIADTIPCNKNYLVKLTGNVEKEIAVLRGWRKSCNAKRQEVLTSEIKRRVKSAEKLGFILCAEEVQKELDKLDNIPEE